MGAISTYGCWVVVLGALVSGITALFDEHVRYKPSICKRKVKWHCDIGICERDVETKCYHGICSHHTGECVCSPCWTGDRCDILENSHMPIFQQQLITIDVNLEDTYRDDVIATVRALDLDAEQCSYLDDCPCSNILYSIEEGNEGSLFMIDPRNGEIKLSDEQLLKDLKHAKVELKISANNPVHRTRSRRRMMETSVEDAPSDISVSTMMVRILFSSGVKNKIEVVHSRHRRSIPGVPDSETFTFEKLDPFTNATDVLIGQKVSLRLTLWLPAGARPIRVELLSQYESSAIMVLCDPTFTHIGNNYPSFDSAGVTPEYYAKAGDFRYNRIIMDLGSVTNSGTDTSDDKPNKISLDFTAILQENNATQCGDSYWVSAGVSYGTNLANTWVGQTSFTPVSDIDTWTKIAPAISISGPSTMTILSSAIFNIDLVVKNYATDFYLDIVSENHDVGDPIMKVCELKLTGKGDNYGCMPDQLPQYSAVNDNSTNATILARLDFGNVVNSGLRDGVTDDDNNSLSTEAVVYITDSSGINNGTKYWLGVTVVVDGENIYSSQQAITTLTTTSRDMTVEPVIEFYAVDGYVVTIGGTVGFVISIDIPENITSVFIVDVSMPFTSNEAVLSICQAEVVFRGYNIPCAGNLIPEFHQEDGQHADYIQFNFGGITNLGRRHQPDDSKLKLLITAELLADHPVVFNGTEFQITAGVRYEMSDKDILWVSEATVTAVDYQHHEYSDNDKKPRFKLRNRGKDYFLYNTSAVSFNITVNIPPETTYTPLLLNITAQTGSVNNKPMFRICRVEVVNIGLNFYCHNLEKTALSNVSTSDEGVVHQYLVDLGVVTNSLEAWMQMDEDDGAIVVEVILYWEDHSELVDGENVTVMVQASYGPTGTWQGSMDYIINFGQPELRETNAQPQFQIIRSSDNVVMTIGSKKTYYLKITTPIMSTPMTINVTLPVSADEAFLTISDMQLVHVGKNYACYQLYEIEPIYNSTYSSSQNDSAFIDLGVITNHGTTHYYQYNPEYATPEEDEIIISLEIQLADHYNLLNEAELMFDVFFDYSLGRQTHLNETVHVLITGDELPQIEFNISIPEYDPMITQQGDLLLTELSIYHINTSSSHAHSIMIYLMLPYYLEMDQDVEIEGPSLCISTSEAGYKLHFAEMYFTDTFTIWFNISMDPNRYMPIDMNFINTVVPLEIIYYKQNGADVLGDVYKTETMILDLSFRVEQCFDVLGVENNVAIQDCQITASSYLNDSYSPQMARLNSDSGWAPAIRDMKPYQGNDYIEIRFGGMYRFSGVAMQKGFSSSEYVTSYELSYSEDGIVWHDYDDVFINDFNDTSNETWVMNLIPTPFNGAYFRIRPQSYAENTTFPLMRFEVYGCRRSVDIDVAAACETTDFPDYPYYERGFIVEPKSGYVYVCVLEYIDGPSRCSYSFDNGTTWEEIDNNVANIIALEPETMELFGISQNRRAIMRSGNLGITWSSMEPEQYLDLSDKGNLVETMRVPFVEVSDVPDIVMETEGNIVLVEWGAAMDGLYRREVSIDGMTASEWQLIGLWGYP